MDKRRSTYSAEPENAAFNCRAPSKCGAVLPEPRKGSTCTCAAASHGTARYTAGSCSSGGGSFDQVQSGAKLPLTLSTAECSGMSAQGEWQPPRPHKCKCILVWPPPQLVPSKVETRPNSLTGSLGPREDNPRGRQPLERLWACSLSNQVRNMLRQEKSSRDSVSYHETACINHICPPVWLPCGRNAAAGRSSRAKLASCSA